MVRSTYCVGAKSSNVFLDLGIHHFSSIGENASCIAFKTLGLRLGLGRGGSRGGRGPRPPVKFLAPVPPPPKKVQDKAATCQIFIN